LNRLNINRLVFNCLPQSLLKKALGDFFWGEYGKARSAQAAEYAYPLSPAGRGMIFQIIPDKFDAEKRMKL
jgi:hypothetical protein